MEILVELRSLKNMEIKPNYSELSRRFKKDRHTIRKMYDSIGKGEKERKPKPSCLDSLKDEIAAVLSDASVSVRSAYWYFRNEKGISCTYSNCKVERKAPPSKKPIFGVFGCFLAPFLVNHRSMAGENMPSSSIS